MLPTRFPALFLGPLLGLTLSCTPAKTGPSGGLIEPFDPVACHTAETHLQELKCKEGTLQSGRPFADFCIEKMQIGVPIAPRCLSSITTCSEIETKCNP